MKSNKQKSTAKERADIEVARFCYRNRNLIPIDLSVSDEERGRDDEAFEFWHDYWADYAAVMERLTSRSRSEPEFSVPENPGEADVKRLLAQYEEEQTRILEESRAKAAACLARLRALVAEDE
jgi:hypothetical protein